MQLIRSDEVEDDLLVEILVETEGRRRSPRRLRTPSTGTNREEKIEGRQRLATRARAIGIDTKARALLKALDIGFEQMAMTGAARKALIFTESRRTQEYLRAFLESHGYEGRVVLFNGTNGGPQATAIYQRWAGKRTVTLAVPRARGRRTYARRSSSTSGIMRPFCLAPRRRQKESTSSSARWL